MFWHVRGGCGGHAFIVGLYVRIGSIPIAQLRPHVATAIATVGA
jgi:hypothetical protein